MSASGSRLPAGLLVSVRSVAEAEEAVAGGAAIIDVKEPAQGPLGRADVHVIAAIAARVAGRAACTVACGELAEGEPSIGPHLAALASQLAAAGLPFPTAVKAGPAGLSLDQWRPAYERLAGLLANRGELVAVAYADWRAAAAPDPARLITAAADAGASTLLIDTFDKASGGLFEVVGGGAIAAWMAAARARGLGVALAGRLGRRDLPAIAALGGRIVGVRSAACEGGRMGHVDRGNVAELVGTLAEVWSTASPLPPDCRGGFRPDFRPDFRPEEISP